MNITQAIAEIRRRVTDDPDAITESRWSDQVIESRLNTQVGETFKRAIQAGEGYYNEVLRLDKKDAKQQHLQEWSYELPYWIHSVVEDGVREAKTASESRGEPLKRARTWHSGRIGWTLDGSDTLLLYSADAKDLEVRCTKEPTHAVRGTLDVDSQQRDTLWLPVHTPATDFPLDTKKDAYRGMLVEVTGATGSATVEPVGEVQRVVESRMKQVSSTDQRIRLKLARGFTTALQVGHTFESLVQAPKALVELTVLMTKVSLLADTDTPLSPAMEVLIRSTTRIALDSLKPRHDSEPVEIGRGSDAIIRRDLDKDPRYRTYQ